MTIHLCTAHGYLHATTVELSSCERDYMAHKAKNIYYLGLYKKHFADSYFRRRMSPTTEHLFLWAEGPSVIVFSKLIFKYYFGQ